MRQKVENKIVCLKYIPPGEQLADICTKGLSKHTFFKLGKCYFLKVLLYRVSLFNVFSKCRVSFEVVMSFICNCCIMIVKCL